MCVCAHQFFFEIKVLVLCADPCNVLPQKLGFHQRNWRVLETNALVMEPGMAERRNKPTLW